MVTELLNENQRRGIATHLLLLEEDLTALRHLPEMARPGMTFDAVRSLFDQITNQAEALRTSLALDAPEVPSLRRRVGAVAEIWASRIEDLVARRLERYGEVHPGLAARLDPRIHALTAILERLADAARTLPEV